ncbi:MAG: trigger factor [Clostridia bacterium]|nr:trigger factor [Clostridia bacterium]
MSLKSHEKIGANDYKLEVEIDSEKFQKGIDKAYNSMKNKIAVPGFRKGKATKGLIERYYGKEIFYEEAFNNIYPEIMENIIKENDFDIVDMPKNINIDKMSAEEGVSFTVEITVKPEIELKDYKGIEVKQPETKVLAADVNKKLEELRDRNARIVDKEGKSKSGDICEIDFEGFVDGEAFEGGKAEDYEITIGSNTFIPGFEDGLIGKEVGDEFELNLKFPEQYMETLAGKDVVFKVKMKSIKEKELPKLDDEFAKDVSEFDTLTELKADIKKKLTQDAKKAAQNNIDEQILSKLPEKVKVDLPDVMVENQIENSLREFSYNLQSQGMNLDSYLNFTGSSSEEFKEQMRPRAIDQLKIDLALEKIFVDEKLKVSDKDIEKQYEDMSALYSMPVEDIKNAIPKEQIELNLKNSKAIEFLRNNAKLVKEEAEKKAKTETAKKTTAKTTKTTAKKTTAKKTTTTKKAPAKKTAAKTTKKPETK